MELTPVNDSENTASTESKSSSSIETFDRMLKLPTVETAWHQSQNLYDRMKNSSSIFNRALSYTEGALKRTAVATAPLVEKLDGQIHLVDRTLVKGIDKLETSAPIIKETPQQIYEQTKSCVLRNLKFSFDAVDDTAETEGGDKEKLVEDEKV